MLETYRAHVADRAALNVPPLPLDAEQTAALCELLKTPPAGEEEFLLELLRDRVPPGVDLASYVKASFLTAIAQGEATSPLITPQAATELLGTMLGGYNVQSLVELLKSSDATIAQIAADGLKQTLLVYDAFNDVLDLSQSNSYAKRVIDSWAAAEWFTTKPTLPDSITVTVFKVSGETNTDDLSPAPHATTRPDIPLHAQVMLESRMDDPLGTIATLKTKGHPLAYVGDVVGTGSSR
ncbi:MAG: aconitate hydratase B, partial [Prochlorothrix sp.]